MEVEESASPGTPVRSHDGASARANRTNRRQADLVQGASLKDPAHLFNSRLEGNTRRAIDEDDAIVEPAFRELIRAAAAFNVAKRSKQVSSFLGRADPF